jgi:uncharacterized protein YqeY
MSLKERLASDMKDAMKARETLKLSVLRMVKAATKYAEIDKGHELNEDELIEILTKEVKLRRDSLVEFEKADRPEAIETVKREISILMEYLPQHMTEEEIKEVVQKAVIETGAGSPKDMGKVMGKILPQTKGRADGKLVSEIVKKVLNGEE